MFKIIILSQIGADRYQNTTFMPPPPLRGGTLPDMTNYNSLTEIRENVTNRDKIDHA